MADFKALGPAHILQLVSLDMELCSLHKKLLLQSGGGIWPLMVVGHVAGFNPLVSLSLLYDVTFVVL